MPQTSYHSNKNNLPLPPTSFVGREAEIAEISRLLVDSNCRLLSLIGPAGIGKTRLAVETAGNVADRFRHGTYLVPLQSVHSTDFLPTAVADEIGFSPAGQEDPGVQLLAYLQDKEMLLVLDNFEHLLSPPDSPAQGENTGNLSLLTGILKTVPAVSLLVTSREALNLQGEWRFPLQGLPFPESGTEPASAQTRTVKELEAYGAVQLFVERAHQVQPDFSLTDTQSEVIRICQLVEGLPLALEIAASWTKTLPCHVIAREIDQNLQFLTTRLRDVPKRQRSLQAVFNHSWDLLTETEQNLFKQLSVFQGGFRLPAVQAIVGASLSDLSALIDKSLLVWDPTVGYHMHELLRQYAEERLLESPQAVDQLRDRHTAYYTDFLHQRTQDMFGRRQREAVTEISAVLKNIRFAWQWAVKQTDIEAIEKSVAPLSLFYQFQSRYLEGAQLLKQAAHSLDHGDPTGPKTKTVAKLLVELGWLYIRLGRLEKAKTVLEQSRDLYADLDRPLPPGQATDPLVPLGIVATIQGDYLKAKALGEAACRRSEKPQHLENLSFAHYLLTRVALALGNVEAARQHIKEACSLVQQSGDRWFMAYCLIEQGNVALMLGDEENARQHYQASYRLRETFDDPEGMAVALNHLGWLAIQQGNYAQAKEQYRTSLAIYQDISDRGGLATTLNGLGIVARIEGAYTVARQQFEQALQIAREIQFMPLALSILCGLGELLLETKQPERGVELLAFVQQHPASMFQTKTRADQRLADHQTDLSAARLATAAAQGKEQNLETITARLATEPVLSAALDTPPEMIEPAISPSRPAETEQPLIDPLTDRELEVLRLIARGHTNQEIANELVIVEGTVKAHASNIYAKLNVNNRTEAVAKARELGLL